MANAVVDAPTSTSLLVRLRTMSRRRWPTALGVTATTITLCALALLPQGIAFAVGAWCVLLAAVIYLVWGVVRGQLAPQEGRRGRWLLTAQTAAVLTFAAAAVTAVTASSAIATHLLAAAWLGHAAWDVAHHRMNVVVPRWYAETCLVSDVLVAATLFASTAV